MQINNNLKIPNIKLSSGQTKNKSNRKYNMDNYMKTEPEWNSGELPGLGMIAYGLFDGIRKKINNVKEPFKEVLSPTGPLVAGILTGAAGYIIASNIIGHPDRKDPDN